MQFTPLYNFKKIYNSEFVNCQRNCFRIRKNVLPAGNQSEMSLQDNLGKLLETQGITAVELAQRSGVPSSRISEIVTGKTKNPQLKTLQKLAAALGVAVDDLTGTPSLSAHHEPPVSVKESAESYSRYIRAVAEMMGQMDEDTQKDIFLSVQKEKLLRELLNERREKRANEK